MLCQDFFDVLKHQPPVRPEGPPPVPAAAKKEKKEDPIGLDAFALMRHGADFAHAKEKARKAGKGAKQQQQHTAADKAADKGGAAAPDKAGYEAAPGPLESRETFKDRNQASNVPFAGHAHPQQQVVDKASSAAHVNSLHAPAAPLATAQPPMLPSSSAPMAQPTPGGGPGQFADLLPSQLPLNQLAAAPPVSQAAAQGMFGGGSCPPDQQNAVAATGPNDCSIPATAKHAPFNTPAGQARRPNEVQSIPGTPFCPTTGSTVIGCTPSTGTANPSSWPSHTPSPPARAAPGNSPAPTPAAAGPWSVYLPPGLQPHAALLRQWLAVDVAEFKQYLAGRYSSQDLASSGGLEQVNGGLWGWGKVRVMCEKWGIVGMTGVRVKAT